MATSDDRDQRLDHIAEEFVQQIRNGIRPSIAEFVEQNPDLAEDVEELLGSIEMLETFKTGPISQRSNFDSGVTQLLDLETFGDYRLIGEVGRGGMGIVFEAVHLSLGRRVAIKVLPTSSFTTDKSRSRFQREARSAACLHHPNIVPVFDVGEAHNYPFYVMEFVDGRPLSQIVKTLQPTNKPADSETRFFSESPQPPQPREPIATEPDTEVEPRPAELPADTTTTEYWNAQTKKGSKGYCRWVADIGRQVADALAYAHQAGILHRDIKPANLIVDQNENVLITDFGLAKQFDDPDASQSGEIVGTPRYMAPESLMGKSDPRSDVYGLGLTLYELVTLTPAFEGTHPAELIHKVANATPPKPRKINPSVPRDLETVIIKAIAKDAEQRYQSAAELSEDLARFLSERPITARRSSPIELTAKWAARNPAIASLTALTFSLLVVLAIVLGVANLQTSRALNETSKQRKLADDRLADTKVALEQAEEANLRAEANIVLALRAFETVMNNISTRGVDPASTIAYSEADAVTEFAVFAEADIQLLENLMAFFTEFAEANQKDLRRESALARQRVGDIQQQLGRIDESDQSYEIALVTLEELMDEAPQDYSLVIATVQVLNGMSKNASWRGALTRTAQYYHRAKAKLQSTEGLLETTIGKHEMARTLSLYASIASRTGFLSLRMELFPRRRNNFPRNENSPTQQTRAARFAELTDANETAIELLEQLVEDDPEDLDIRLSLARVYREQCRIGQAVEDHRASSRAQRQSINQYEILLEAYPDSTALKYELAETLCIRAGADWLSKVRSERASRLSEYLVTTYSGVTEFEALRGQTLAIEASIHLQQAEMDEAQRCFLEAIELQRRVGEENPRSSRYQFELARTLMEFSELMLDQRKFSDAADYLLEATTVLEQYARRAGRDRMFRDSIDRLRLRYQQIVERLEPETE